MQGGKLHVATGTMTRGRPTPGLFQAYLGLLYLLGPTGHYCCPTAVGRMGLLYYCVSTAEDTLGPSLLSDYCCLLNHLCLCCQPNMTTLLLLCRNNAALTSWKGQLVFCALVDETCRWIGTMFTPTYLEYDLVMGCIADWWRA